MHTDKFEMGCTKIKTVLRKIKEQDARRYTQIDYDLFVEDGESVNANRTYSSLARLSQISA